VTALSGFDRIRIINLPSRADRRKEMRRELRQLGIEGDPRINFIDGVIVNDKAPFRSEGEKGVFLAHLNILKAAAADQASVLILEDDVDFTAAAYGWHRPTECDIAYGGYSATDPGNLETSDIVGAHCMGFSARAARALAPFLEQLLDHPSPPPIDGAYVWFRRQHADFATQFARPIAAVQRPSRSDITRRAFDKVGVLRAPIGAARRAKRILQRSELSFGLREAAIISLVGIALAVVAAVSWMPSN